MAVFYFLSEAAAKNLAVVLSWPKWEQHEHNLPIKLRTLREKTALGCISRGWDFQCLSLLIRFRLCIDRQRLGTEQAVRFLQDRRVFSKFCLCVCVSAIRGPVFVFMCLNAPAPCASEQMQTRTKREAYAVTLMLFKSLVASRRGIVVSGVSAQTLFHHHYYHQSYFKWRFWTQQCIKPPVWPHLGITLGKGKDEARKETG